MRSYNKSKNGRRVPSLVRKYGEPLFKCVFDTFGVYTWGRYEGKVNPKAHATVTMFGDDYKDCKSKLEAQSDGVFFKPSEIVDLNPEYSKAYDAMQQAAKEFAKKFAAPVEGVVA